MKFLTDINSKLKELIKLKPLIRYFIGFMTVIAVTLIIFTLGFFSANRSKEKAENISKNIFPKTVMVNKLGTDILYIKYWLSNISATRAAKSGSC